MPAETGRSLRGQLLQLFGIIYVAAFLLLFVTNIIEFDWQHGSPPGFWLVEMAALGVLFIVPGYAISAAALRPLFRWLAASGGAELETAAAARRAALSFPWRALAFFTLFGIVSPALFHGGSVLHDYGSLQFNNAELWASTVPVYLNELSLSIALGTVFSVAARRKLRPFLRVLPPPTARDVPLVSIRFRILLITAAVSMITGLPMLIIQLFSRIEGWPATTGQLVALLTIGTALAAVVGLLVGSDISADLRIVTDELTALTANRRLWRKPLAMANDDEIGELALAFNRVRAQAEADNRELEAELELARRVQSELLPKGTVLIDGWAVDGASIPARQVGGDFFDVVRLVDGRFVVVSGDASGSGMPAALLMAAALSVFRAQAQDAASPAEMLGRMNRLLYETIPAGSFVAAACALVDPLRWTCTLSSAGHVDPLVIANGLAEYLPVESLPLGVAPDLICVNRELQLKAGERLLFFSDGLPETRNGSGAFYGFDRLAQTVALHGRRLTGASLVSAILRDACAFAPDAEPDDDLTAVIIEAPANVE